MKKENFSIDAAPRIAEERAKLGLTQEEAATSCGVSRAMWGRYERGIAAMGGEYLRAFAAAGADAQYILTGLRTATLDALKSASQEAAALDLPRELQSRVQEILFATKTGNVEMLQKLLAAGLKPDEAALLDNYRHCPPEGKAALKTTSAALAQPKPGKKAG